MHNVIQELRFALRRLRRAPGFTFTAILTLALSIGAVCVMYTVVQDALLAPLPYPEPNSLVGLGLAQPANTPSNEQTGETVRFLVQNAKSYRTFGIDDGGASRANFASGNGQPQSILTLRVDAGFLPTLGVSPSLGRSFTEAEDAPGSGAVVILSHGLWQSALGGDPTIIGRAVRVNGDPATVVGVMPAGFATADAPDLWQPLRLSAEDPGYFGTNYRVIARLRPGNTMAQARAELSTLNAELYRQLPRLREYTPPGEPTIAEFVWPLGSVVAGEARPGIVALSAAVLAVLLIACLNLASLMTARSAVRHSELALRSALGAGRGSLLLSVLSECFVLALAADLLGLAGTYITLPVLLRYAPLELPKLHPPAVGLATALFATAVCLGVTVLFGLLSAAAVLRRANSVELGSARTVGNTAPRQRLGKVLLGVQVALATALLACASVLLTTFVHLRARTPGLRPQSLDVLQVQLEGSRYTSAERTTQFVNSLTERLSNIPGVESAAAAYGLPLDRGLNNSAGPADRPELIRYAETRFVTPGYFQVVGTPLLAGEDLSFATHAATQPVALISSFAAERWFGSNSAALDRMVIDGGGVPRRVLGVVAPVHASSLADQESPMVYLPIEQVDDKTASTINGWFPVSFALRLRPQDRDDHAIAAAAGALVSSTDPDLAVSRFIPMQNLVEKSYAAPRFFSWLAGGFAAFSLLLTVVGLFGLLMYQVSARTQEIGVRMAVGAGRFQIAALVLRRGVLLTALGLAAGLLIGIALQSSLITFTASTMNVTLAEARSVLPGREGPLLATIAAMLLTAFAACLLPALRAASVNPTEALRTE